MQMRIRSSIKSSLIRRVHTIFGSRRVMPITLAALVLSTVLIPTTMIYVEALQKADGSQNLMTKAQPGPIPKRIPEGTINPVTHKLYKDGDVVKEEEQKPVKESAKSTATTVDPIEAYNKEKQKTDSEQPKILLDKEVAEKRTENSRTYKNSKGTETKRIFSEPVNYKSGNKWQSIDGVLKDDVTYNNAQLDKRSIISKLIPNDDFVAKSVRQDDGLLKMNFKSLADSEPAISVAADKNDALRIEPLNTNTNVNPTIETAGDGGKFVQYLNAWNGADLFYEQRGESLKEYIRLNNPDVQNEFKFRVDGATLQLNKDDSGKFNGTITATLPDKSTFLIPELSLSSMKTGPVSNPKMSYSLKDNVISVTIDKAWLQDLPKQDYPFVVDPSYSYTYNTQYHTGIPGGDLGQFIAFKSDGYRCNSNNCDLNVGTLNDGGAKTWRSMLKLPVGDVYGKPVAWANIYTMIVTRPYAWPGFAGSRTYNATWANCIGYNCISGAPRATGNINGDGNLNATALMQWFSGNNVGDAWLALWANNEADINSFKALSGGSTYLDVIYQWTVDHPNQAAPLPTLASPAADAVVVVQRPTLKANPVTDPDGDLVRYAFRVKDSKGNVVAYSPELDTPSWTVPDKILMDSEKYSWSVWILERNSSNPSVVETGWRPADENRQLNIDLRLDKDRTQTYDDVGPISVNMNTGSLYTGNSTHSISALGGDIGLGLSYNQTSNNKRGLSGRYYSGDNSAYNIVTDPTIDLDLGSASPFPGIIPQDDFTVTWTGIFIAPQSGQYTFGSKTDGTIRMTHPNFSIDDPWGDDVVLTESGCCGFQWGTETVNLQKGESYRFEVDYDHTSGNAYAQIKVRTPDNVEQIIPSDWLRDDAYYEEASNSGLSAKFYKNVTPSSNPNFNINDTTPLVYATNVPQVDSNWGTNSLVPVDPTNEYAENTIVVYKGYVTIPVAGSYQFGGSSDDGMRIRLGNDQVLSQTGGTNYSSAMQFDAGQVVPIQVTYYEATGAASVSLRWNGPAGNTVIPAEYFHSTPQVVPYGWNLSIDPDGNIPYETLIAKSNGNVELLDSSGFTHDYTWTGDGYKPSASEDGYLIRNSDGTFTLTGTDGRVYNFSVEGVITSITSPIDDKNPAAVKYEYQNNAATSTTALPKLSKIVDGVDSSRYGKLYYWGEADASNVCSVLPGFDTPPTGYLCAFKTFPDNVVTKFHYKNDWNSGLPTLARIEKPGNSLTDYSFLFGQITATRDAVANDGFMSGWLDENNSLYSETQLIYDELSRVSGVRAPSALTGIHSWNEHIQIKHSYEYGYKSTKKHVQNVPEPSGYTEYIEYDDLFRTTKACDNAALCTLTQWDPNKDLALSSTDAQGMMSTMIYDDENRPVEQYEAAPAAWFGADRKPLAAYVASVPKNATKYDEGIAGPAVAWYGARGDQLFGAAKLHTTGITTTDTPLMARSFVSAGSVPVVTDTVTPGYGFSATGKIRFPAAGLYTFQVKHDDGVRLYVDDKLILADKWNTRTAGNVLNADEATFNAESGKTYRFRLDYIHFDDGTGAGSIETWLRGPGITDLSGTGLGTKRFGSEISPAYGLATSASVTDSVMGTTTVNTTYQDPAYGLVASNALDPTGLNYVGGAGYEAQGTGYLRQTSKTLPGGNTTAYTYYGNNTAVDNPCTTVTDLASQAGRLKMSTEPDPDGTGPKLPRKTESVYDSAGRVVATRVNSDPWTCTTYDLRGRISQVQVPQITNASNVVIRVGSTVSNNYAVGGNPFITSSTDSAVGTITTEVDMLGRVVRSVDTFGNISTYAFDSAGRPLSSVSLMGTEEFTYDAYGRAVDYKLNNIIYATITYDNFSRIAQVSYPQSKSAAGVTLKVEEVKRDARQRGIGAIVRFSNGTAFEETLNLSSTGLVSSSTDKFNSLQATSTYTYDKANRLTQAVVDKMKYDYGYSASSATTCNQTGANLNAHKNTNRTSYAATNLNTNAVTSSASYCYNSADQLVSSTDTQLGAPVYDEHGNTTSLGGGGTPISLTYNNLDQNTAITQGTNKVVYTKASDGTIMRKKVYQNNVLTKSYRYIDGGRIMQSCSVTNDSSCTTTDSYLDLPGGVSLTLSPTHTDTTKRAVYSVKNFHGDTAMTVNTAGVATSSVYLYEPFGQTSNSSTFGTNSNPSNATDQSMGWASDPSRKTEGLFTLAIVQMGARVYLPSAGRFLQVDPVDGGSPNAYAYAGDPINSTDYSGQSIWSSIVSFVQKAVHVVTTFVKTAIKVVTTIVKAAVAVAAVVINNYVKPAAAKIGQFATAAASGVKVVAKSTFEFVGKHSQAIGTGLAIVGLVACTVATVGACGVATAAIMAASATVSYIGARYEGKGQVESLMAGGVDAAISKIPFGGPGLKAVRYFGPGRQYKSIKTALAGGHGAVNDQAMFRLAGQGANFGGGQIAGGIVDTVWK